MSGWTTTHGSRVRFVADEGSLARHGTGIQIKWSDVSTSYQNAAGKKVLPAGTVLGTLLGSGKASPRVINTNPATGILETTAVEDDTSAPGGGMYGLLTSGNLYENLLPEAAGSPLVLDSDVKDELLAAGCYFRFQQYVDTP